MSSFYEFVSCNSAENEMKVGSHLPLKYQNRQNGWCPHGRVNNPSLRINPVLLSVFFLFSLNRGVSFIFPSVLSLCFLFLSLENMSSAVVMKVICYELWFDCLLDSWFFWVYFSIYHWRPDRRMLRRTQHCQPWVGEKGEREGYGNVCVSLGRCSISCIWTPWVEANIKLFRGMHQSVFTSKHIVCSNWTLGNPHNTVLFTGVCNFVLSDRWRENLLLGLDDGWIDFLARLERRCARIASW